MRNSQIIIVFIRSQTWKKIFRSALVYIIALEHWQAIFNSLNLLEIKCVYKKFIDKI